MHFIIKARPAKRAAMDVARQFLWQKKHTVCLGIRWIEKQISQTFSALRTFDLPGLRPAIEFSHEADEHQYFSIQHDIALPSKERKNKAHKKQNQRNRLDPTQWLEKICYVFAIRHHVLAVVFTSQ
ncbi:MAG: hypothetical protein IKN52_10345 [Victivallales bacterium]|nr:hypothetical protein [Victivallales bacterium]